jgi:type II secretory pathway pseudopilin PulG
MRQNRAISRNRRSRRGISLIEFMVVVTAVATMLGLCAVTIQALLRVNADAQARVTAALALERLARQFRSDVHATFGAELASDPKTPSNPAKLLLKNDSPRVVAYSADPASGTVARDEVQAGKITRHESYALGRSHQARFELFNDALRQWARLVVTQNSASTPDPPRPIEVLALRGKDRLAHALAKEGGKP